MSRNFKPTDYINEVIKNHDMNFKEIKDTNEMNKIYIGTDRAIGRSWIDYDTLVNPFYYPYNDISETKKLQNYFVSQRERGIKNVIFNDPATIVYWNDGTKTVVKCHDEKFDPEKGLAMAISKKFLGTNKTKGNYYDIFEKWLPKDYVEDAPDVISDAVHAMAKMFRREPTDEPSKDIERTD